MALTVDGGTDSDDAGVTIAAASHGALRRELLPLTAPQRGLWFAETLSPGFSVNIAQYIDIRHEPGGLDIDLFVECCYTVGKLMEIPYIRLADADGVPMQYLDFDYDQHIEFLDFSGEPDPFAAAVEWMETEYRLPVDLVNDQLIVVNFLRVADDHTLFYQRAHHIIVDGNAALTMARRAVDRYNALRRGQVPDDKPVATLAEIIAYEADYRDSTRYVRDKEHWGARISEFPEPVSLSTVPGPVPLSFDNVVAGGALPQNLQDRLDALAGELQTSVAVLLTAAFAAFMGRMAGSDDVVLSLPVTGRATAKIKASGGMVSNVLPIRLRDVSARTARELIDDAQLELTGALRHQRYRSDDIRRDAGLDGGSVYFGPAINMMFFDQLEIDGTTLDYRVLTTGIIEDLAVNLYQPVPGEPLAMDFHGNPNLYSQNEIEDHHRRFLVFARRFVDGLDHSVGSIDLLVAGEHEQLESASAGGSREWTVADIGHGNLLDLFTRNATDHPARTAVLDDSRSWTYRELDWLRRDLAERLGEDGVESGDRVAICLPRGIDQVVAIYAVLTVGAAYVPVDVDAPHSRRQHILETARPVRVVDADFITRVGFRADRPAPAELPELPPRVAADAPAYVIFTSGSTGRPKGVEVSHRAVLNRLAWVQERFALDENDVWLYKTPFTFDPSVIEYLWPLQRGARTVIARAGGHRDPRYLREVIERHGVTVLHFVPSMLDVFADDVPDADAVIPPGVRMVFASGEALPAGLAGRIRAHSQAELINLYGPTEAAVDVTEHVVTGDEQTVPIGRVVANTQAYVLDRRLRPLPFGRVGELYLAGVQLAHGYFGAGGLTADRFIANPFVPGERMYRTGDLVSWNANGELEYLGRTDFQVKVRGQRVELGEIENTLLAEDSVRAAVVVPRELPGSTALVAYVKVDGARAESHPEAPGAEERLLHWCRSELPAHMVPSAVVTLDTLPTNSSGKLDRAALPDPVASTSERSYVAPRSAAEREIVALLEELIDVTPISVSDNIFSLGANSLVAARLAARARSVAGYDIALADIFESGSVADIAAAARPVDVSQVRPPLVPMERPDLIPLSYPQARLWFINRVDPAAPTYNMPGAIRLPDDIDVAAMRVAVADLITRHESLRTRFPSVDGDPVQEIVDVAEAVESCRLYTATVGEAKLRDAVAVEAAIGFDLATALPVRCSLFTITDDDGATCGHVLMVVLHHIAGDGASLRPLIRDLLVAYSARAAGVEPPLTPLAVQYADFGLWQREVLGDRQDPQSRIHAELEFWRSELRGAPELLPLPTDHPRPSVPTGRGGYVDVVLDGTTVAAMRSLAGRFRVTTFTVLHLALATLLSRLAGTEEVSIGTPVAGRDEPETENLIGMFVNTVVLRTRVAPADTVAEALAHAHRVRSDALSHAQVPFEQVVEALGVQRSLSRTPLFQVALTMVDDHRRELDIDGVSILDARVPAAKYELAVTAVQIRGDGTPNGDQIELEFAYSTDLFTSESMERMAGYLVDIIGTMAARPQGRLGGIDLLPADETQLAVQQEGRGEPPATLRTLLAAGTAAADTGTPAILGTAHIDRQHFATATNQLAHELIARGVGPGDVVALAVPRSHLSILATVAVIKTGAAFLGVDPRHPFERRAAMLADSRAILGIASAESAPELTGHTDVDWIILGDATHDARIRTALPTEPSDDDLTRPIHLDDPAYLIYTSGSTGRPKATVISNRGVANLFAAERGHLGLTKQSRVLHVASPSFDASVLELTMALGVGATLVVADVHTFGGHELESVIAGHRVTHVMMTPSVLATVDPEAVPSVRWVLSGGEACPPELMRRWSTGGRRFMNLYGPTEVTIWSTVDGPLQPDDDLTIGRPLNGVGAVVLDACLRPAPVGVTGELYLAGDQLGLGYLHRTELTATRFVANPFDSGTRLYRTGDRVARRPDGRLDYFGRSDFQLKIRGLRIEPAEVDSVLLDHPWVSNALTVGAPGPAGETLLVSYIAPADGHVLTADDALAHARNRLPSHLVPHSVVILEEFPTTTVGKINRRELPAVDFNIGREFVAPRTPLEEVVAEVFAQVLGLDRVSVGAGFFELGGNSLGAAKLATALSKVVGRPMPIRVLLEASTVAAVAEYIDQLTGEGVMTVPLVARHRPDVVPVSEVQRGLWLLNRAEPDSPNYNVDLALRLTGHLDVMALDQAIVDLLRRQQSLRTYYPMVGGGPVQVLAGVEEVLDTLDLRPTPVTAESLRDAIWEVSGRGFDVTTEVPLRLRLFRLGPDDHVLIFVIHHLNADGASILPMARDFVSAYAARTAGQAPAWLPLRVHYSDFALWQRDRLAVVDAGGHSERDRQLAYWRERLAGAPEEIGLPFDRPRPPVPSYAGAEVAFEVPAELVAVLESIARSHNATLFMVLHSAVSILLSRLNGSDDIVVGTPYAGRTEPALDDVVGMFVNSLALRTAVDPTMAYGAFLDQIRDSDLADMTNADVAFESVVEAAGAARTAAFNPLFQVMLVYQNVEFPRVSLAGIEVAPHDERVVSAKVDLELTLFPGDMAGSGSADPQPMRGALVYATDLYDAATVEVFAERFVGVLEAIAVDPHIPVGDLSVSTVDELRAAAAPAPEPTMSLPDLVWTAASAAPDHPAFAHGAVVVTFAALAEAARAMAAAMPDADSALVTALMTLVPTVAGAGPQALGDALATVRETALATARTSSHLTVTEGT
ncbi:amino acid adenylation domain-containing protein [Gordonia sp. NPDC003424]